MGLFGKSSRFNGTNKYGNKTSTILGKEVKSNAEKIIADYFTRNGIRYEYERRARGGWFIFTKEISRPDFYLPDYGVARAFFHSLL